MNRQNCFGHLYPLGIFTLLLKTVSTTSITDRKIILFIFHAKFRYQIKYLYFTGPDRVNILRVHKPNQYGDKIDHHTTVEVQKSGKISNGIEIGPLGRLTLRVVAPRYEGNRLIGYVAFGEEIEHITKKMHKILGVEIYVVLKKEFLNRKNWETGMHLRNRKAAWEQFPLVVMVEQTMEDYPDGLIAFLDEEYDSSMKIEAKVSLNDRRFFTGFMPLEEVSGRKV